MPRFARVVLPQRVEPVCPAGLSIAEVDEGSGCLCRIDGGVISSRNPSSARQCFTAGYVLCSTWRRDKEHAWAQRTNRDLLTREGNLRVPDDEDREHVHQREVLEMVSGTVVDTTGTVVES